LEGKNVFIQDNDSTFGTLVLIQSPKIKLIENLPLYIQIGRTFFQYNIQITKSFFWCCGISEKPNANFYFKQNEKDIVYKRNYTVLNIDKNEILENNGNNNNSEFKNNEEGVINIKKINIKNKININGNDFISKIKSKENIVGQKENGKEENIIEDKENILNKNENKNKEEIVNGAKGNEKLIDDGNNRSSSIIYIEDES
jgi:hypothetical protein